MKYITKIFITDKTGKVFRSVSCATGKEGGVYWGMSYHLVEIINVPAKYSYIDLPTLRVGTERFEIEGE